jgi:predicted hydrocarbon binding protein
MDNTASAPREVAVPVSVFAVLRKELATEIGTLAAIHALHDAGYQAGVEAARGFPTNAHEDVSSLAEGDFWTRFTSFFARRGWGNLTPGTSHPAVGLLDSTDWVEAADLQESDDASCAFSAGFLSGLLSTLAAGPVAVLEVACRARGDERCSFAFGSETAVHELYGYLLDGEDLDGALTAL